MIHMYKDIAVLPFDVVYKEYQSVLNHYAFRYINDTASAEDIVTEILLNYWAKEAYFDDIRSVRAFLFKCLRNACINFNKQQKFRTKQIEKIRYLQNDYEDLNYNSIRFEGFIFSYSKENRILLSSLKIKDGNRFYEFIYKETIKGLHTIIKQLPPKCQEVMELSFVKGLSCSEIAVILNRSVNTIRNQRQKGLQMLKKEVGVYMN